MAMSLKNKLFDYFAIRHLNLMPPETKARFEDYIKNGDFQGQMKSWTDDKHKLYGVANPDFGAAAGNPYELTAQEWEELYDSLQKTFQEMNERKDPSVGIKSDYKNPTKDFIKEFFGDDTKTFTISTASKTPTATGHTVEAQLSGSTNSLVHFLEVNKSKLQVPFLKNLSSIFSADFTYDKLIDGLKSKKYNNDLDFRKKLEQIIGYINYYGPANGGTDKDTWPDNVGLTGAGTIDPSIDFSGHGFSDKVEDWFEISNKTSHIDQLKKDWPKIFDTLITKKGVRDDFIAASQDDVVKKPLSSAIEQTDYENKDSDNYIPKKYADEKDWRQILQDKIDDAYEDYFRKFTNPSRGTRLYFSPWTQNIIKAFDKEKIKPTDGIKGIIDKKSAIVNRLATSPTSKKHFEWFAGKMEFLSKQMSKAFEGALSNGSQLRELVAALINEAVEEGKIDEAYTALEILSVAKYGLLCSRTFDKLKEATKDMSILSDKNLSFNKNEAVQSITKAMDATAGFAIRSVGAAVTGFRNFIQHRRTKFKKDISKHKTLNDAYKKKEDELQKAHTDLINSNVAHNVAGILTDLNSTTRTTGGTSPYKTTVQINKDNIEIVKANLETAKNTTPTPAVVAPYTCTISDLENDIKLFDDAYDRQKKEDNWDKNNINPYDKLIAYWDMLETYSKSHSFTLGSMSAKRKSVLAGWTKADDRKKKINSLVESYGHIRTAA